MEYYVVISQVLTMFVPHEDVIMDGKLAYNNYAMATNCIVSAVMLNGVHLLAVTPLDAATEVSFQYVGGGAGGAHTLVNLETKGRQQSATATITFSAMLTKTAAFMFSPA